MDCTYHLALLLFKSQASNRQAAVQLCSMKILVVTVRFAAKSASVSRFKQALPGVTSASLERGFETAA